MKQALALLPIPILFGIAAYIQYDVWNECRAEHSFFYCLSLVSK